MLILNGCQLFGPKPAKNDKPSNQTSNNQNNNNNNNQNNNQNNNNTNNNNNQNNNQNNNNNTGQNNNQTTQDPVAFYGVQGFVDDFNNKVGSTYGVTLTNPKFYQEDAETATFSITLSDGNGVGIVVVKDTRKMRAISIVSPASTNAEYDEFFKAASVFLRYIDASVSQDDLTTIFTQLGYGKPANQLNFSYESTDLLMKTEYNAQGNELYFDINYKNN
jgi:hypothetical protein